jgi:hypothetical protein
MAACQRENQAAVSATKIPIKLPAKLLGKLPTRLVVKSMIAAILCAGSLTCAQAQDAQPNNTKDSWTATTQTAENNTSPSRTMESHAKSGDRSVDKQRMEVLGENGQYLPDFETDKETIQVNATTTRTVVRTYRWDVNGQKTQVQMTEEEARSTASGDAHVVRTISNPDANGNLQVVQREVADTKKTSPDTEETKSTVYFVDGNGALTPSVQTEELQKTSADHSVAVKNTTLVPDSSGNWVVGEVKESTIKEDGKKRTSEERVSRPGSDGSLSEVLRTVGTETETAAGEKTSTVDTFSKDAPGLATDGSLQLNRRETTVQKTDSGGKTAEQQVEERNPDSPNGGLQVRTKTKYIVQYAASGTQQTKTVQERDVNGNFNVVSVETRKSDEAPAVKAQTAPPDKPQ